MAKDDFHVIVYQILAYLYQCLKRGEAVKPELLGVESDYFKVNGQKLNERYWRYIIFNLQMMGLIEGIGFADIDNLGYPYPVHLGAAMITPAGIEYLTDDSFLQKAKMLKNGVKTIARFV